MSLTIAFKSAQMGLIQAEKKLAISSGNINNADRPGYTRKTLQSNYLFNGTTTVPIDGKVVQAVANPMLTKQVIQQSINAAYQRSYSTFMSRYAQAFGSTAEDAVTLQSSMTDLASALQVLEANPGDEASKSKVVSTAAQLSSSLNGLSQAVQNSRLQANHDIVSSVESINGALQAIATLNQQISLSEAAGRTVADLEDERNIALQGLAQEVGIQYFINDRNQALVYSSGGSTLVSTIGYAQLSYTPVGVVTPGTVYPGGFSGITLNGADITSSLQYGRLGALVALRDTAFPKEQEKLDAMADTLQSSVNRVLNQGAAYPPLQTIKGTVTVTNATAFSGTGNFRVAVTDSSGGLTNYTDINLATLAPATVGGLITALNGIAGVSASINSDGYLEVTATASTGRVSMNPLNSNVGGVSATQFFGFNNLFVNATSGAATIAVNPNLSANFSGLAVGTLSSSTTAVAGDFVLSRGDVSTTRNLVDMLKSVQSFPAAGNFSARSATLAAYAGSIIADAANQATIADNDARIAEASYTYLSDNLANESGINIDEETANLTILQTAYQANAQVISTVKTLFQTLIDSMR